VNECLLTARELGELLGFSAATIVDWSEAGKLPAFKIGGRLRFRASEVEAWLQEHRHVTSRDKGFPPRRTSEKVLL
jgi:excisionase family DNA binding protein